LLYGCSSLTSLDIPANIQSIQQEALANCSGLTSIHAYQNTPVSLANSIQVFYSVPTTTCMLYVPIGSKSLYKNADQWSSFTNILEFNVVGLTTVGDCNALVQYNSESGVLRCLDVTEVIELDICDLHGKVVFSRVLTNKEELNLQFLSKGLYLIRMHSNRMNQNLKIIRL